MALALALFCLALAAKLPAQPQLQPPGWLGAGIKDKNPSKVKECHLPLEGHCSTGGEAEQALPGEVPGPAVPAVTGNALWEQLGASAKEGRNCPFPRASVALWPF